VSHRLDKLEPSGLDPEQRELYDAIAGGPRAQGPRLFALVDDSGRLEGPFNAMLLSPPLGAALQALGAAVRYRSQLPDRAREIAILIVAHSESSAFEVYAHEAVGRQAGLTDAELDALRARHVEALDVFADRHERVIARATWALATRGDLTESEYLQARDVIGATALFELTTLAGYYRTLALQLRVFAVAVPGT
jgi:4-carboxymuconolactone decarboxylase